MTQCLPAPSTAQTTRQSPNVSCNDVEPPGKLAHAHLVDAQAVRKPALVEARLGVEHGERGVFGGLEIGRCQDLIHDAKADLAQPIGQERGYALARGGARIGNMKDRRRFGAAWLAAGVGHEEQ